MVQSSESVSESKFSQNLLNLLATDAFSFGFVVDCQKVDLAFIDG